MPSEPIDLDAAESLWGTKWEDTVDVPGLIAECRRLRAEVRRLDHEHTLIACVKCERGVRDKHSVKGMCPGCAEGEILRLQALLDRAWDASGLLSSRMTGQPGQAWEEPSDLVGQIEELASKAGERDEAEADNECLAAKNECLAAENERLMTECDQLRDRCSHALSQWALMLAGQIWRLTDRPYEAAYTESEDMVSEAMATWDRLAAEEKAAGLEGDKS